MSRDKGVVWDLEEPVIPPRSTLYHLEPIGVGTPYVEALSSYWCRLADAHCFSPTYLFFRQVAIPLQRWVYLQKYGPSLKTEEAGAALNGLQDSTVQLVERIEWLTGRYNLACLTMLTWRSLFSEVYLLRRYHKAWCSQCLKGYRRNENGVYEPLLWFIEEVRVCPIHENLLSHTCPECGREIPILAKRAVPGLCSWCGEWLGAGQPKPYADSVEVHERDLWTAQAVGDLLALAPELQAPPAVEVVVPRLRACLEAASRLDQGFYTSAYGPRSIAIRTLCPAGSTRGTSRSFTSFLLACYGLNVQPAQLIREDPTRFNPLMVRWGVGAHVSEREGIKRSRMPAVA